MAAAGLFLGLSCDGGVSDLPLDQLAAAGDSLALGRRIRAECRRAEDQETCYQDRFVPLARAGHVRIALGALAALARSEHAVQANGHVYTHVIGISAWQPGKDIAATFAQCTVLFQSGCYHGVIQSYLTDGAGLDSAKVANLCDVIEGDTPRLLLRFQCAHGLGHGLEMALQWELPRALEGCDWLVDPWDRQSCYGGAFMENAVAGEQRHTAARVIGDRAAGGDEPDGDAQAHRHGPDPGTIRFKLRDTTDLLYPCNAVAYRYVPSCYVLQGGLILRLVGFDFDKATAGCDLAPESYRHMCYVSIGTSVAGYTVLDARRSTELCGHGDPDYQPWCFVGAAKNFVDVTTDAGDGLAFCRQVPAGKNRRQCYVAVGEHMLILFPNDSAARSRECATAPPGDREDCRYGALLAEAPEGLPILPPAIARQLNP